MTPRRDGADAFGGHRARRRFSQNFLVDQGIIERIVAAVAPKPGERIVEIGPGRGALTAQLLRAAEGLGCELVVIEIDRDLVQGLRAQHGALRIIEGDALRVDYSQLFEDGAPFRVLGNLPYNISSPLIFRLLGAAGHLIDAHFMLQEEVVNRMGAAPGDRSWGRLGVMVQYRCRVDPLFAVPPEAFHPRPRVHSRIVRLQPYATLPHPARDEALFARVVRDAFSQRRKTLRNALRALPGAERLTAAGFDLGLRAEMLSVADFVAISNVLADADADAAATPCGPGR
ncbi:MAG: 16S rRNA (adenine(1518)-N(6)/adenine(1519)-N(6))-dimethyltransferase RsmA [Pseudomonadales bacterium]|jgi:16S rRNA (adenine1518-N6/adenine1519-N6)-dimethyltransferase|nr:16S rRNA (adenine(1518)-N(6)/adenine(1519)-N(6))-dimethyltransferase RsmA [Pseudomonadales bacterium]